MTLWVGQSTEMGAQYVEGHSISWKLRCETMDLISKCHNQEAPSVRDWSNYYVIFLKPELKSVNGHEKLMGSVLQNHLKYISL